MKTKPDKSRQRHSVKKKLRDQTIIAKAMAGETTVQIAEEMGMHRQQVSKVLNSEEVKAKVKEIDAKLAQGIDDAIDTVLSAVKVDYVAARDLLKNYGSMKQAIDLNHTFPKPTVIVRSDGTQVVLGTTEDGDKNG